MPRYNKIDIARYQLKTAITLFLSNEDLSSVITLAGAAANILHQLVINAKKEAFIDFACKVHNDLKGKTPPRKKYLHFADQLLGISVHKHMSDVDKDVVQMDLQECAINSLTRAVCDYVSLCGQEEPFVKAYLNWSFKNKGVSVMASCEDMPEKYKKMIEKEYGNRTQTT